MKEEIKKGVVFWVVFKTVKGDSGRMQYFEEDKSKLDFFNWITARREEVELSRKTTAIIKDCGLI